jgi:hypothetical protein
MTERRACRVARIPVSTFRYESRQEPRTALRLGGWPTFGWESATTSHELWLPHPSRFSKGGRHEPKHLLRPTSSERNTHKPVTHHSPPIVPRSIMFYASASAPLLRSRLSPLHHHQLLPASATAEQSARPRPSSECPRAGTAPLSSSSWSDTSSCLSTSICSSVNPNAPTLRSSCRL